MFDLTKRWPLGLGPRTWPLHVAAVVLALVLAVQIDAWASQAAVNWPDALRAPFFFVTDYGLAEWTLVPSLVVFLLALAATRLLPRGTPRLAACETALAASYIFAGVAATGLLVNLVKRLVGRARPHLLEEVGPFDFRYLVNDWTYQSFPSGHTTTAIAVAFLFGFLWPRLFAWLFAIGLVVAVSRVPVGAHYPADVVGGLVAGTLGAYAARNLYARRRWLFELHADGHVRPRGFPALRRLLGRGRQRAAR